jgi:hypothetical protein
MKVELQTREEAEQALLERGIGWPSIRGILKLVDANERVEIGERTHISKALLGSTRYLVVDDRDEPKGWTVAYRRPHAPLFHRLPLDLTWQQAVDLSGEYIKAHPELQVWYVGNAQAEADGRVCAEDAGNILTDTGRRVRVVDIEMGRAVSL